MRDLQGVELPKFLRTNPRDRRGFPIPYIVVIDANKNPQFTVNDARKVRSCINKVLCALCGKRMTEGAWFIGGPRSFFSIGGMFLDPPAHKECSTYALQICPFLAAPRYSKLIDLKLFPDAAVPEHMMIIQNENAVASRPSHFLLGRASRYTYVATDDPRDAAFLVESFRDIEVWQHGARVVDQDKTLARLRTEVANLPIG